MKAISTVLKLSAISAALVLAACTTQPEAAATQTPPVATQQPNRPPPAAASALPGSAEDFRVNVGDTVHFDLDKYDIRDGDKAMLQRQAAWLSKYPNVRITIEGNADERGTREYNLALGARRANSVKEYLVSLGTASGRVETVSYGKERPVCAESTEGCWAQNRRGVTTITSGAAS